jgi:HEAT repeat protein
MRIKDIDHDLALYEKHNIIRGEALEEGNSSKSNYHFDKVQELIGVLKAQNAITELFKLLKNPHSYVRLNAAVQLKDCDEKVCLEGLQHTFLHKEMKQMDKQIKLHPKDYNYGINGII